MRNFARKELKQYVRAIYDLEASIYKQDRRISALRSYAKRREASLASIDVPETKQAESLPNSIGQRVLASAFFAVLIVLFAIVLWALVNFVSYQPPILGQLSILLSPFSGDLAGAGEILFGAPISFLIQYWPIVLAVVVLISLILGFKDYVEGVSLAKKRDEEIKKITLDNSSRGTQLAALKDSVGTEIKKMQEERRKTASLLDDLYRLGGIHAKYRGLIPMASICEYIESGSCDTLKEAYNKYDLEARLGTIISKLDVVIDKLDSISSSQHLLYSAIQESNRGINAMTSSLSSLGGKVDAVSLSSANSEYYNRITAENAQTMKTYMLLSSSGK